MNIPTAAAEAIFHIGTFPVTNSLLNGWIAVVFFVIMASLISERKSLVPKGLQNVAEAIVEFILGEIQKVTGDAARARKFLPIVGTIFLFILFSNWLGLLPGTGSIGVWEMHEGALQLIPLLRPAASDLNLTLAIALFAVLATHVFGIVALGPVNHFSKFVNVRGIFQSFKHGPMAVVVAVIEFFVGLLEIISVLGCGSLRVCWHSPASSTGDSSPIRSARSPLYRAPKQRWHPRSRLRLLSPQLQPLLPHLSNKCLSL